MLWYYWLKLVSTGCCQNMWHIVMERKLDQSLGQRYIQINEVFLPPWSDRCTIRPGMWSKRVKRHFVFQLDFKCKHRQQMGAHCVCLTRGYWSSLKATCVSSQQAKAQSSPPACLQQSSSGDGSKGSCRKTKGQNRTPAMILNQTTRETFTLDTHYYYGELI